jgi:glycerophosphoryl diester phosphodiesterase
MKWLTVGFSAVAAVVTLLGVMIFTAQPATDLPFFAGENRTQVIAHRGGSALRPENTLIAFAHAVDLGIDILEMDVRLTADGTIVVIHDATVDRTTNGTGHVKGTTLEMLHGLDAGYRWSMDGGKTHPYRGAAVRIPTLDEVFAYFAAMRMNIEMKDADPLLAQRLCALIRSRGMGAKVLIASFHAEAMSAFRTQCSEVATSMTASQVQLFVSMHLAGLSAAYSPKAPALQIPYRFGDYQLATSALIQAAHRRNLRTHVWTINDEARMRELIAAGIDGIITDRPDLLLKLVGRGAGQ